MKGLALALAASLLCAVAITVRFRAGARGAGAAAMLRIFMGSAVAYAVAYRLTPKDLGFLPVPLVEPRDWLGACFGLVVHGALFFGGWLQLYNLADRGFSLHVLMAIDRSPARALTFEEARDGYGGGRGMAGLVGKRIDGLVDTGLATVAGGRLRCTAKGVLVARIFGALRAFLQIDTPP